MRIRPQQIQDGSRPATAAANERLSCRVFQGIVTVSKSPMLSPDIVKAAANDWIGNVRVCFSRLNRSSSRTNSGLPSANRATPASWLLQAIPRMFKADLFCFSHLRWRSNFKCIIGSQKWISINESSRIKRSMALKGHKIIRDGRS